MITKDGVNYYSLQEKSIFIEKDKEKIIKHCEKNNLKMYHNHNFLEGGYKEVVDAYIFRNNVLYPEY